MPQFTIHLTTLESKLLEHTVANPADWIDNLVEWRVRIAEDEYLPTAIAQLKASGATSIPGTRDEIIMAADLPPKDPNWTPAGNHLNDDVDCVEYYFDLEDDDIKMLAFMWENPHTHIRDLVIERCQIAIKEKADLISKELLADPTWTQPIPLDPVELIDLVNLVTVADHMVASGEAIKQMNQMMLDGTLPEGYVPPSPAFYSYKHHEDAPPTGTGPA